PRARRDRGGGGNSLVARGRGMRGSGRCDDLEAPARPEPRPAPLDVRRLHVRPFHGRGRRAPRRAVLPHRPPEPGLPAPPEERGAGGAGRLAGRGARAAPPAPARRPRTTRAPPARSGSARSAAGPPSPPG